MGMHNKGTYTRVLTYAYTRIDIRVYAYIHTLIRKIRAYNTRMRSSDISELHCIYLHYRINKQRDMSFKFSSTLSTVDLSKHFNHGLWQSSMVKPV